MIHKISLVCLACTLVACSNPRLSASGDQDASGMDNNNGSDPATEVTCRLSSSDKIAVWLETANNYWVFGEAFGIEDCPEGPSYVLEFFPTGIFVVAASSDLEVDCNVPVDIFMIDEDPAAAPYSFWDFEMTLNNLWLLPGYWSFDFFPETQAQAEGFELGASAFICALGLDMLNLGCDGYIASEFFLHDGPIRQATFYEGYYMPILRFGLVR